MSKKYWEEETPKIFRTEKNEVRFFTHAEKIQIYTVCSNTAHGVGKGVTIDVASMTLEEKQELLNEFSSMLK